MSPHYYFAIFLFVFSAAVAAVASNKNQQALTGTILKFQLDVANLDDTRYQTFITGFRNGAKDADSQRDPPILPASTSDPDMLNVDLQLTPKENVSVRFRRDNLYVRGYRMQTNQWMELYEDAKDTRSLIANSKKLNFFGSYAALEKAARTSVGNINFSKNSLISAIWDLSKSEKDNERAKSLIFMALMISEAARFKDVSRFFGRNLQDGAKLPGRMMPDLLTNWLRFSKIVQCYDAFSENYVYTPVTINGKEVKTVEELRGIFGIMLKVNVNKQTCGIRKLADEGEGEAAVVLSADM